MNKVFMFVNVDWFFLSHRQSIAKAAHQNNIEMSVYTDFTETHEFYDQDKYGLFQSPISRSSDYFGSGIIEFIKSYFLIYKLKPAVIHAVTIKPIMMLGIVARFTRTPFVGSISGLGPVFSQINRREKLRFKVVIFIYRFIFRPKSAVVICQSEHDKNILLNFNVCSESKISMITGSGVDLDKYSPDHSIKNESYILMASRMLIDKGTIDYCSAAKYINGQGIENIKFKLAGPIDELSPTSISEQRLRSLCKDSGVEYLGNRSDLNVLLASAMIFIMPSYYPEGVPKVLLEAAASGTPIITTDHPGCRDVVLDKVTGILVEPRNPKAISVAILDLLENTKTRLSMGVAGRELAEQYFDQTEVIDAHYQIYNHYLK